MLPRLVVQWQAEHHGPEAEGQTLARFAARHHVELPDVLKAPWVPLQLHLDLLRILEEQGHTAYDFQAMGRHCATHVEQVVPGASLLLRLANPASILRVAPTLWRSYADFGTVDAHLGHQGGDLLLRGVPANAAFCATMQGFFSELLRRAGGHDPSVDHRQCVAHGDACCVFHSKWA